ncbi:PASTA domain-containing protein [Actinocorallia sp. B10E7]|uniref:PASTA domain-containing protein n=1 Tax=Actinocorallia sp. B10E7 TaxID=3153558 RepID=UPI00325F4732
MPAEIEPDSPSPHASESETPPHTSESETPPHASESETPPHASESETPPHASGSEAVEEVTEPATPMSFRSMVLLGTVMSLGVALVLGLTLLVGGGTGTGRAGRTDAAGTVPSVAGRSLPEATSALASRRLAIGSVIRIPSSLPPGQVVRTTPEAGSPAAEGTAVTVYVSSGTGDEQAHDKVTVPYLLGVDGLQAQRVARQLGLRLDPPAGGGRVSSQQPEPGTEVARGSAIKVTLD